MNKKIISGLITTVFLSSNIPGSYGDFNYKYRIKGNSLNPLDTATVYYYKEEMIDKYEDFFFTLDENYQKEFVKNNIVFFKLYDNAQVTYIAGTICVTIGEGKGISIEGRFKKNECDNEVINEKYFILELFK